MGRGRRTKIWKEAPLTDESSYYPAVPHSRVKTPMLGAPTTPQEIVDRYYSDLVSIDQVQEGQMGRDYKNEDFQLLQKQGDRVRMVHLGRGVSFWVPSDQVFLQRESVSFPPLPLDHFGDPQKELQQMIADGQFDRFVEDGSRQIFRIGNWVLEDDRAMEFVSCQAADGFLENRLLDVRARDEALSFKEGALDDPFEKSCQQVCHYLSGGKGDLQQILRDLQKYSEDIDVQVFVERMQSVPQPLPGPGSSRFIEEVAPLWREAQRFRVARRSHLLLESMRNSRSGV